MAEGNSYFDREVAAGNYYASSGHGGVGQHFVQNDGGAPAGMVGVADTRSRVSGGIGKMDPTSFPSYGSSDAPMAIAAPARPPPPRAGSSVQGMTHFKGPWTAEEDAEKVDQYGNGKWAKVAQYLPGRSGKQCRERWINQLDPNIERRVWTDAEDMELIDAHQTWGNRWSVIAKLLTGRSENSVKNHWNATKRSLKAKRQLKKRNSEQPPAGQLSLLAEYIRSLEPHNESPAGTPPASPPLYHEQEHGGQMDMAGPDAAALIVPTARAQPAYPNPNPAMTGMYYHQNSANMQYWPSDLNAAGGRREGYSDYIPPNAQLNHRLPYGLTPAQMIGDQDLQQVAYGNASMNMYPFADQQTLVPSNLKVAAEIHRESSTNNNQLGNAGGGGCGWSYYYDADVAGPSGPAGGSGSSSDPEDMDVVRMASREFAGKGQEVVTLDHLTRFK